MAVLSLEQATTLPFLTYRLACDGARVIRVENAERPDPNRFVGRDVLAEPAMRSYFLPNNCGKEAITLNLGDPEGQSLLRELIVKLPVDVFACNQRPRGYARLGIEPRTLAALRSAGVPVSRVNTVSDVMTDRLVAERLVEVTDPRSGLRIALPAPPVGEPPALSFPPRLGEHNEKIYGDVLGLPPEQVAELRRRQIV